jgi:hypothetical protein
MICSDPDPYINKPKRKKKFIFEAFVGILSVTDEKAGSGSVIHCYGSADPDPYQNVTDPQHAFFFNSFATILDTFIKEVDFDDFFKWSFKFCF